MRFVRQVIADRLSGGVLALLLAFMLMLDGTIGMHAQASMASAVHAAANEIICSTNVADSDGQHHKRGSGERPECCSAACQFAAQFAATDLPAMPVQHWPLPSAAAPLACRYAVALPRLSVLHASARGPPAFSI